MKYSKTLYIKYKLFQLIKMARSNLITR